MLPFIERAVKMYGSQEKLAKRIGVSQAAISQALHNGCSAKLAAAIVRDSNGLLDAKISELVSDGNQVTRIA
jgi:DNA-binding transcriptional regulator YdaS (Cro superfamily)